MLQMFKTGAPGSIWLSIDNKPVKNITSVVDDAFKAFENVIMSP